MPAAASSPRCTVASPRTLDGARSRARRGRDMAVSVACTSTTPVAVLAVSAKQGSREFGHGLFTVAAAHLAVGDLSKRRRYHFQNLPIEVAVSPIRAQSFGREDGISESHRVFGRRTHEPLDIVER